MTARPQWLVLNANDALCSTLKVLKVRSIQTCIFHQVAKLTGVENFAESCVVKKSQCFVQIISRLLLHTTSCRLCSLSGRTLFARKVTTLWREREGGAADDDGACGDLCNCICGAIWRSW